MKLVTDKVSKLNDWTGVLEEIVEKATFRVSESGLSQRAKDPAHICMIDLNFDKNDFIEFDLDAREYVFTTDSRDLSQILQRFRKDESITLQEENGELKISSENEGTKEFTIPLLARDLEKEQEPDLDFEAQSRMSVGQLKDEVKNVALVDDHIGFKINDDKLTVYAGKEHGSYKSTFTEDEIDSIEAEEESETKYQVSFLEKVLSSLDRKDDVDIALTTGAPLQITNRTSNSSLKVIQAPIIKE